MIVAHEFYEISQKKLSNYISKWFSKHDVTVVPNSVIDKVEPGQIFNNGVPENVDLVVWTAGIQPVEVVRNLPIDINNNGRVILNQYHQIPTYPNVYVVGDCADLPHAPSAQLAELQGEQIADVMKKQWNNEPLPDKMPELKVQGFLGSLGDKQGFAYIMDRTVTGRLASILKSGVLWLYKYHNG